MIYQEILAAYEHAKQLTKDKGKDAIKEVCAAYFAADPTVDRIEVTMSDSGFNYGDATYTIIDSPLAYRKSSESPPEGYTQDEDGDWCKSEDGTYWHPDDDDDSTEKPYGNDKVLEALWDNIVELLNDYDFMEQLFDPESTRVTVYANGELKVGGYEGRY